MTNSHVPFFRPSVSERDIAEVIATLRSGWLTTGPKVKRFEEEFAKSVEAPYAVAVNSCTAALHLAVEALNLKPGEGVLVPTMTFAATAEIVRYQGAMPVLVDCDPVTGNMDLADAERKITGLKTAKHLGDARHGLRVAGMIPVHVGGLMMNMSAVHQFAANNGLWIVEDAAHAFPAAWRSARDEPWQRCGGITANAACFSFYANKTITTGEGGMVVTQDGALAQRIRLMSLHGLSHDAWGRYESTGSWDYRILAPGYKYNLTDVAAALGIHQLDRAEELRLERERIAHLYLNALAGVEEIELPPVDANRIHSWHLFPIRLQLDRLSIARDQFMEELRQAGVGCSVHWRPLHLHPYHQETFGWKAKDFPVATSLWQRLISLPIFPSMTLREIEQVIDALKDTCARYIRRGHTRPGTKTSKSKGPDANYVSHLSQ